MRVFDDQYISSGGQLYELMVGHDRFNGDIRPALMRAAHLPGNAPGMAAHPYDVCTELIAREAGVIVTALDGGPLRNPLTVRRRRRLARLRQPRPAQPAASPSCNASLWNTASCEAGMTQDKHVQPPLVLAVDIGGTNTRAWPWSTLRVRSSPASGY